MTISVHAKTAFTQYEYFKEKIDEVLKKYSLVIKCLHLRSQTKEFANEYFKNTNTICKNPKFSILKIQRYIRVIQINHIK
jgi:hypothetical protein